MLFQISNRESQTKERKHSGAGSRTEVERKVVLEDVKKRIWDSITNRNLRQWKTY